MAHVNIIDLDMARNQREDEITDVEAATPEDLISAIQSLIQRLRESRPLKQKTG